MNKTNIEYLSHSWNPLAMKCAPISEGCANCWHLSLAKRLAKNPMIPEDRQKAYAGGEPVLIEKELDAPLKLKKPAIIGVQFMGDLFYEKVPGEFITKVFYAMQQSPQHIFLVLTKRPKRMAEFLYKTPDLPHIYLGVTCENQRTADERIPILLQIPAATRFISIEPMLSEINLRLSDYAVSCGSHSVRHQFLRWAICGGESGPGARPMRLYWARSIRDQCQSAGVPFFMKQMSGRTVQERHAIPDDLLIREYPKEEG